ncbi:unnamed protein product [Adineta steineri]|uniref:NHL repeat containing protein-like protein n=1 Tax=Adineta steineri TaxID=433720 RepID=A0A815SGB6_9BILA|nr:unnamed protein product [Adineta steineri]
MAVMVMKYGLLFCLIIFILIPRALPLPYNQPKFCPTTTWDKNSITFANVTTIGAPPRSVFVTKNNTVYVPSYQNNQTVVWLNNSLYPSQVISGGLSISYALFVTDYGDTYIDNGGTNHQVDKWIKSTNTFINVMNISTGCWGIFIDINNTLYCSLYSVHKIVKRWLNSIVITSVDAIDTGYPNLSPHELNSPIGIFIDVNFDIYVADCGNYRIQVFRSGQFNGTTLIGNSTTNISITLNRPTGVVLDSNKYLFIADQLYHRIIRQGPSGFYRLLGCTGQGSQADRDNNRIQKFIILNNSCGSV